MRNLFALTAAIAILVVAPSVHGQPSVYESFGYPTGSLNGQNGGSGFGSPWTVVSGTATVQPGSLTPAAPADGLPSAGNSVSIAPANPTLAARASRTLAQPVLGTAGTTFWVSAVMRGGGESGAFGQGSLNFSNGLGSGFGITTGATGGGPPPAAASSTWSLGDASSGFFEAASTVPNTLQSLLVARATFGTTTDTIELFVNPPLGGGPPASPNASVNVPHIPSLTTIDFVYGSLATGNTVLLDEIRLGNSFAAVTGVPEPSTLLLAGLAGVGGAIARRRRAGHGES